MIDVSVLTPPPGDLTVKLLDQLFGHGWQNIIFGTTPAGGAVALREILGAFNLVTLTATTILICYIVGVGLIGTAHEGQAMGKRYSTLWTPLRSAFSVAMLVPLPWAGISILQGILLLFVYYGIGGAGYLWTKALDYMGQNGGEIAMNQPMGDVESLANGIFKVKVVQSYLAQQKGLQIGSERWEWLNDDADPISGVTPVGGTYVWTFGVPAALDAGDMGRVTIPCPTGKDSPMCQARAGGVQKMINTLRPAGGQIASFYEGGANQAPPQDVLIQAMRVYYDTVRAKAGEELNHQNSSYQDNLADFTRTASEEGWAAAGSWYWTIAKYNEKFTHEMMTTPTFTEPDMNAVNTVSDGQLNSFLRASQDFAEKTAQSTTDLQNLARGPYQQDGAIGMLMGWISRPFSGMEWPVNALTKGDPVANLQSMGNRIMTGAWGIAGTYILTKAAIKGNAEGMKEDWYAKAINIIPGAGYGKGFASAALTATIEGLGSLVMLILVPLFALGLTLAYYLPAVPFILWVSAIIGWLIMVAETLVAAPLWAAAHAAPEGEGMAGQHGKQGYMLFLGVLLRPPLMVIGFFMSFILFIGVGEFIGTGFKIFGAGMQAGHASGPITFFAFLFLVGATVVISAHRLFGLITWLPDNVLRWIGQQVQNLGEGADEQRTRTVFAAGVGKVAGGHGGSRAGGAGAVTPNIPGNKMADMDLEPGQAPDRGRRG
ncbi:MAG: DotA/TraY family protein [Trichloromonadaceae bacterium]